MDAAWGEGGQGQGTEVPWGGRMAFASHSGGGRAMDLRGR